MSWVAIIIVLIVLLLIVGVLQFNRLRRLNIQVDGAFAGIDTLLTKRADLIPNLVETVKGAACMPLGEVAGSSELLAKPTLGRRSAMSTWPIRSPRMETVPMVGNIRVAAIDKAVVFPAPLGPTTTQRSTSSTVQFTLCSSQD